MYNMEEMIMDKKKERKLILETVMELKRPFSLSFLFMSLKEKVSITDFASPAIP